jgi:hypothetical protein
MKNVLIINSEETILESNKNRVYFEEFEGIDFS